jgi:RNA polymerase sigma-70 factor (ECF subfamily)
LQFQSFDESYVQRLRDGDFRTQEHFVNYFSEFLQLKLRSRLQSQHAIEDVRQETFARVLLAVRDGKMRQPERLGPYVNSICTNVLRESYRNDGRTDPVEEEDAHEIPADTVDPIVLIITREIQEQVRAVLDELGEKERRVLTEIFLKERDKEEVCREFGVTRDYLRVLLHRAKTAFKSLYLRNM